MVTVIKKGTTKKRLAEIFKKISEQPPTKSLDAKQFCGTVKFKSDALALQKRWRNEWE